MMSPNSEKSTKIRLTDRKRSAILDAAVDEFQKNGFGETSMDQIAATAAVSKRTVYNHFPSKDVLFQAILQELAGRIREIEYISYDPKTSLESQLTRIGESFAEVTTSEEVMKLSRVVISRFIQSASLAKATLNEQAKLKQGIVDWIVLAKKDGRLQVPQPKRAAEQFAGLIKAFVFWPPLMGSSELLSVRERNQVVRSAVSMFLDHYST